MLKTIDHKSWPFLQKLDDIMLKSTASGWFTHNGANKEKDQDSGSDSEPGSALGLTTDQGSFTALLYNLLLLPFYHKQAFLWL